MSYPIKEGISTTLTTVPKGDSLAEAVTERVKRAMIKVYPQIADSENRLISVDRIIPGSPADIAKIERQERQLEGLMLYQALKLSGIPADRLNQTWYSASEEHPYYWNPLQPEPALYINEDTYKNFWSDDVAARVECAVYSGFSLININLNILGFTPNRPLLPSLPTRELIRVAMERTLFAPLEEEFADLINKENFARTRELIDYILELTDDQRPRFMPTGALIYMLMPGQDERRAEFFMGKDFEINTMAYLADPVRREFLEDLKRALMLSGRMTYEKLIDIMGMRQSFQRQVGWAKLVYPHLGLGNNERKVFDEYCSGNLPAHFITARTLPGIIDPWLYGEKPMRAEEALEKYLTQVFAKP